MKYKATAYCGDIVVKILEKKFFNKGKVLKALSTLSKQNLIIFDDSKKTVFEIEFPAITKDSLSSGHAVDNPCPTEKYFKPVVDKLKKIGKELGAIDGALSASNLISAMLSASRTALQNLQNSSAIFDMQNFKL